MEYLESQLIRRIDAAAVQELGIPGLLLMENAARGVCEVLEACKPCGRIVILCGPGNNGGDGLAVARLLAANDIENEIHLVSAGKSLTSDAQSNLGFLQKSGIEVKIDNAETIESVVSSLTSDDWIVDALLGTGISGTLRKPFYEIVEAINQSVAQVMSIDVPSGLNSDTGEPGIATVRADITVTFVATKHGFRFERALPYLGRTEVQQIGIPKKWLAAWCQTHQG